MKPDPAQRAPGGRFGRGNTAGTTIGEKTNVLRERLLEVVTPDRFARVWDSIMARAEGGDMTAAREMNQRTLGKPVEHDIMERMEAIEKRLNDHEGDGAGA